MKDEEFRQFRDVTIILGDSIIKNVKGLQLTDEPNKVVLKSFRGATTGHGTNKSTTEQNLKYGHTFWWP